MQDTVITATNQEPGIIVWAVLALLIIGLVLWAKSIYRRVRKLEAREGAIYLGEERRQRRRP